MKMLKHLNSILLISRTVRNAALKERMMYSFLFLAFLFILMANVPFIVDDTSVFAGESPQVAAIQIGFVSLNIFTLLIAIFVSVTTLQSFLSRERLILLLSKPIKRWQILIGVGMGLFEMVFLNWYLMTSGIWLILFTQTKDPMVHIWTGMGVTLLLGLLYISLVLFCFVLIPNVLAGVLAVLLVISGFGAPLAKEAFSSSAQNSFFYYSTQVVMDFLPPVNSLFGLSMNLLKLFEVEVDVFFTIGYTLLLILFLSVISCWKFCRLTQD